MEPDHEGFSDALLHHIRWSQPVLPRPRIGCFGPTPHPAVPVDPRTREEAIPKAAISNARRKAVVLTTKFDTRKINPSAGSSWTSANPPEGLDVNGDGRLIVRRTATTRNRKDADAELDEH